MGPLAENNSADTVCLLERARQGDREALNEIFSRYRDRLRRMVELRLDWRLQARPVAGQCRQRRPRSYLGCLYWTPAARPPRPPEQCHGG